MQAEQNHIPEFAHEHQDQDALLDTLEILEELDCLEDNTTELAAAQPLDQALHRTSKNEN
jgi:hypothetical protein